MLYARKHNQTWTHWEHLQMFECIYIFPPQGSCTATMSCTPYFYSCSELLWTWKDDQDIKCPALRGPVYPRALLWPSLLFLASGLPPRHAGGPSVLAFCDISLVSRSQHCDVFTFGPLGMLPSWGGPSWVDDFGGFTFPPMFLQEGKPCCVIGGWWQSHRALQVSPYWQCKGDFLR